MSAQMDFNKYNNGLTIDDFMEGQIFSLIPSDHAIVNMCLTNGTMGRPDQLKLRELYPGLFDAVTKYLNQKKRGHLFIYEEEGKPKVVNFFIHDDVKTTTANYNLRTGAIKALKTYIRNVKIPSRQFVWIHDGEMHKRMISDSIQYRLGWSYEFIALRKEPVIEEAQETDF